VPTDDPAANEPAARLLGDLRRRLAGRRRSALERPQRAAVLVPLIDDGGPPRLLLIRRAAGLPTHQGQVAFPGGFVGPGEHDPVDTALREAEEEVGLPRSAVEVLGLLDDLSTRSDMVAVTPVVGRIARLPALRAQPGEVARIFEIPLAGLALPGNWTAKVEFEHEGEILWGLSARIVLALLDLTPGGSPISIPGAPWR
jgi:8-oxo-dGTP pyrophosphatase MutT (NUDIX family)